MLLWVLLYERVAVLEIDGVILQVKLRLDE